MVGILTNVPLLFLKIICFYNPELIIPLVLNVFRRVRIVAKSTYYLRNVLLSVGHSVCPHVSARLQLEEVP
jgi:hypothetical protein